MTNRPNLFLIHETNLIISLQRVFEDVAYKVVLGKKILGFLYLDIRERGWEERKHKGKKLRRDRESGLLCTTQHFVDIGY